MQKVYSSRFLSFFLIVSIILSSVLPTGLMAYGETESTYVETFENCDPSHSKYEDGLFTGVNNIEWQYTHSRGGEAQRESLMLRNGSNSGLKATGISGGIKDFSVEMKKAFTGKGERQLQLIINGEVKGVSQTFGTDTEADETIYTFEVKDLKVAGDFDLEIRLNYSDDKNRQVEIDNLTWTSYAEAVEEPDQPQEPGLTYSDIATLRPILSSISQGGTDDGVYLIKGEITGIYGGGRNIFIQDETAGIVVRLTASMDSLAIGQSISVKGSLGHFNHLGQINVSVEDLVTLDTDLKNPTAKELTISDLNESNESQLVKLKNLKVLEVGSGTNYNVTLEDASENTMTLRVEGHLPSEDLLVGRFYDLTGVVSQYSRNDPTTGYQVMTRYASDLVLIEDSGDEPGEEEPQDPDTSYVDIVTLRPILDKISQGESHDQTYLVKGLVTAVLGNNRNIFIQDHTAGVVVRLTSAIEGLEVGQTISVEGTLGHYKHLGQLNVKVEDLVIEDLPLNILDPKVISAADLKERHEGQLVNLKQLTVLNKQSYDQYNVTLEALTGEEINLRVEANVPNENFEIGKTYDITGVVGQYSNDPSTGYQLMTRSSLDVIEVQGLTITPISDIRAILMNLDRSGKSDEIHTVRGTIVGLTSKNQNVFIKDETGYVVVRTKSVSPDVAVGKSVLLTGQPQNYNYLGQVYVSDMNDFMVLNKDLETVSPETVNLTDLNEAIEAKLVKVEALKIEEIGSGTNYNIKAKDSEDHTITLRVEGTLDPSDVQVGNYYDVTAMVGQYSSSDPSEGYQLLPRSKEDLTLLTVIDELPPVINHIPVESSNIVNDLVIESAVTDDLAIDSVKLHYQINDEAWVSLPMVELEGLFTAVIPSSELEMDQVLYYIQASDGMNVTSSPSDISEPYKVILSDEDITGPEFTKFLPGKNAVLKDENTPIGYRAEFSDPAGINVDSVKMWVNDVDVISSATVQENSVSYTPEGGHPKGTFTVKVQVEDKLGNLSETSWQFTVGEKAYNYYFGQLHAHSTLSDGQGTITEAYAWARDQGGADFFAMTDHSNWFDNDLDWTKSERWKTLKDTANSYNDDGNFVAIPGYEMTWSGSTGGWGHINTFNTEWFESRSNKAMDLRAYYARIASDEKSISQLNHPGKTFGDFADFGFYSEAADAVVHLVEVGNGEGPIRGSGYFPSFEYYTRALDKGWHVAPSINQDNHRGNWVSSNEGRTVVLSESLERERIYESIRSLKTYASEDRNLEISYNVNGNPMGTVLDDPESLSFDIKINDPDTSDVIKKVSIIADGGVVVKTKTFETNQASWQFEISPQYTYYYVRVDQGDKDIAVSAPIWAGSVDMVGLSGVVVKQDPMLLNDSNEITATVYNNGKLPLAGAVVEFYLNSVTPEHKIGEESLSTIMPASVGKATINFKATKEGEHTIIAKMVTPIDGVEKVFQVDTKVMVGTSENLSKIVLDASHFNAYISGVYPGKYETLKNVAKDNRYMLVVNEEEITSEVLENTSILILADPISYNQDAMTASVYSDAEVAAIKAYVEAGGSVIVTSGADYKDASGELGNAAQSNKVLEAIGSNLRLNDNQIIDNVNNGGQSYRLYFDQYDSSLYDLTKGVATGETFSFYSGNSVHLKEGGDASNIDWIVKGHDTTESSDGDKAGDASPVQKGDLKALAAEKLPSGGKVVAGGTTFYSDFETANSDNAYSNLQITLNILEWMIGKEAAPLKKIVEVRVDANKDNVPDLLGQRFTVEGYVTAQSEAVTPKNAFFEVIYIQDETGGITVFGVSSTPLPLGTKVRITGQVGQYENDSQLAISNESTDLLILEGPVSPVAPKKMSTHASMLEENEGWLVALEGQVLRFDTESDNAIIISDGSGEARVYLNGYIGDGSGDLSKVGKWDEKIQVGDTISVVGLAAEDMVGPRIRIRNTQEIVLINENPVTPTPTPTPVQNIVNISLNTNRVELEVGTEAENVSYNLSARVTGTSDNLVQWTSSNESVASVDENGLILAVGPGTATITVKRVNGSETASAEVEVFLVGEEVTPLGGLTLTKAYMKGYGDGTFRPESTMTRGEFATVLNNILELKVSKSYVSKYKDLPESHWAYDSISALTEVGILRGFGDSTIRADQALKFGEMASALTFFWKHLGQEVDTSRSSETIDLTKHWSATYIYALMNRNILALELFDSRPDTEVTRINMVKTFNSFLNRKPLNVEKSKFTDVKDPSWIQDIEAATSMQPSVEE